MGGWAGGWMGGGMNDCKCSWVGGWEGGRGLFTYCDSAELHANQGMGRHYTLTKARKGSVHGACFV